jgi:hypothetical protein
VIRIAITPSLKASSRVVPMVQERSGTRCMHREAEFLLQSHGIHGAAVVAGNSAGFLETLTAIKADGVGIVRARLKPDAFDAGNPCRGFEPGDQRGAEATLLLIGAHGQQRQVSRLIALVHDAEAGDFLALFQYRGVGG